jgi:hypothetical protein
MPFRCDQKNVALRLCVSISLVLFLLLGSGFAQSGSNPQAPLKIFTNYFVTGDYVVGGWREGAPDGTGYATGVIKIPDDLQPSQTGVPSTVPKGADIVAAYLYWATAETQFTYSGQLAYFNGSKIVGSVLGNPNAPTSWSSGGCTGSANGSKTMVVYRADVRPFLPMDLNASSATFGAIDVTNGGNGITVRLPDSGSNGNTVPFALGASLVVIYRQLAPPTPPLNAIVLYDGSFAPNNSGDTVTWTVKGFYQPSSSNAVAKLTQIVANGQPNKLEQVILNNQSQPLPSLYPSLPPFPGIYHTFGGAWDNPTWLLNQYGSYVLPNAKEESTTIMPSANNSGCVNWGALVFSTTVQDSDGDGLVDAWETGTIGSAGSGFQDAGYKDEVTGQWVALPGADPTVKDIFVELDYLVARGGSGVIHSHLPKQAALDAVGAAFGSKSSGKEEIDLHFDLGTKSDGTNVYPNDSYVVQYPLSLPNPLPDGATAPPDGTGGNEIPEGSTLLKCADPAAPVTPGTLCAFPGQPAVSWKGGFEAVKNSSILGNFQQPPLPTERSARSQSYRYALAGHALGEPRSYWGTAGKVLADAMSLSASPEFGILTTPQLVSIAVSGTGTATATIKSPTLIALPKIQPATPPLMLKPGDCAVYTSNPACISDKNTDRITISGSLTAPFVAGPSTQPYPPLNGTYSFLNANVTNGSTDGNGVVTQTVSFSVVPSSSGGPAAGTYQFSCAGANQPCFAEPQLGISYMGPTTSSGHSDFTGGGDLATTLGLWGFDNASNCQADPSVGLGQNQVYCDNQVGTVKVQTGTLMHELGHDLTLTHGGTYYDSTSATPGVPIYEVNCKPNFLSVMNYFFQVRGFADGAFDYSGQSMQALDETYPNLNESTGLGLDELSQTADHQTRWYSAPNMADNVLQDYAKAHCDGTPLTVDVSKPNSPVPEAHAVRVEGTAPPSDYSTPLDWNNDLIPGDAVLSPGEDLNHNGKIGDPSFSGFNDWAKINLQQINARGSGFGFSEGGGLLRGGGGLLRGGGGTDGDGGGLLRGGGGLLRGGGGLLRGGGGLLRGGGGVEQDTETANSTADAPLGLSCLSTLTKNGTVFPACELSSGVYLEKSKAVPLTWTKPDFGQIVSYSVWRASGTFTAQQIASGSCGTGSKKVACITLFTNITASNPIQGTPPIPQFIDTAVKSGTYTYFVTDSNLQQANSSASAPLVVTVK